MVRKNIARTADGFLSAFDITGKLMYDKKYNRTLRRILRGAKRRRVDPIRETFTTIAKAYKNLNQDEK